MIGLNYTYYKNNGDIILKNYLLFFGIFFKIINTENDLNENNVKKIIKLLEKLSNQKAKKIIKNSKDNLFDSPLIKKLLELAYDNEINEKLLNKKIKTNDFRMNRIINIFNKIYNINYKKEIKNIKIEKYNNTKYISYGKQTFNDIKGEINNFSKFIFLLLNKGGYKKEAKVLENSLKEYKIKIIYDFDNTSVTKIEKKTIILQLNCKKITTFYHEYIHVLQKIIKQKFNIIIKDFSFHEYNEGVANFFAYNLFNNIQTRTLDKIDLDYIFFPRYSHLYKKIIKFGSNSAVRNFILVMNECKKIGYTNNDEINTIYQRFFKFFPLNQHKYLYPKELLYKIGYEKIIKSFPKTDKIKHISELLLYKKFQQLK